MQGLAWDPLGQYLASQSADRSVIIYHLSRPDGPQATRSDQPPALAAGPSAATQTPTVKVNTLVARKKPKLGMPAAPAAPTTTGSNSISPPTHSPNGNTLLVPRETNSTPVSAPVPPPAPDPSKPPSSLASDEVATPWSCSPAPWRAVLEARQVYAPSIGLASAPSSRKLYGDEAYSPFFRRLAFAPDGSLLITPAGVAVAVTQTEDGDADAPTPSAAPAAAHVFSRASWTHAHSPVGQVAVRQVPFIIRFSPVRYALRTAVRWPSGVSGPGQNAGPSCAFNLPYRLVYAVGTADSIWIHDTQQLGPLAVISQLHYAPLTDLSWSPDGNMIFLSSRDGYCSAISFGPQELGEAWIGSFDPLKHAAEAQAHPQAVQSVPTAVAKPSTVGSADPRTSADAPTSDTTTTAAVAVAASAAATTAASSRTSPVPTKAPDPNHTDCEAALPSPTSSLTPPPSSPMRPPAQSEAPVLTLAADTAQTPPASLPAPSVGQNNAKGSKKRRIQPTLHTHWPQAQ